MLITLTTDLGTRDYYAAMVKGELLKAIPGVQLIDISHQVEPFNIIHAAFVLKNAYAHFPEGTIHLVGVNPFGEARTSTIIVKHENYFFIGENNGLFSLVWQDIMPKEIFQVTLNDWERKSTMPMSDAYVRASKHIASGKDIEEVAQRIPEYKTRMLGKPIINNGFMKGSVVYLDHFGNAMVNISREEFDHARKGRNFTLIFKRYDDLQTLSENYSSVEESEKLCLFNSAGYLEIAINKGNARNMFNLCEGDMVQIEFVG